MKCPFSQLWGVFLQPENCRAARAARDHPRGVSSDILLLPLAQTLPPTPVPPLLSLPPPAFAAVQSGALNIHPEYSPYSKTIQAVIRD